jgi:deoxyadenosine/deoxycytidine kinase
MSTDRLLNQIKLRARDYEQTITAEYLEKIHGSYLEFIRQQPTLPTLIIDANNINFVNNKEDYKKVTEAIFSKDYELGTTTIIL